MRHKDIEADLPDPIFLMPIQLKKRLCYFPLSTENLKIQ